MLDSKSFGRVCLEFLGTSGDRLESYPDLVAWARRFWIVGPDEERTLTVEGRLRPDAAAAALGRAIAARDVLERVLSAVADRRDPEESELDALNRWIAAAASHRRLAPTPRGLRWRWPAAPTDLDRVLWPVAQSAAEMLASDEARKLRRCAECGRLFLDATKNASRRFCGKKCGDRVKARRYYRRLRSQVAPSP